MQGVSELHTETGREEAAILGLKQTERRSGTEQEQYNR